AEEYEPEYLDALARLCAAGFGEVEVHLHHDRDTADGLRHQLLTFKGLLAERHGLLARHRATGALRYGFIHGNWALCNSRPDGRWCGVNNELDVLRETGCYADFTMPSAPHPTQTRKHNSIYYASDRPARPTPHHRAPDAARAPRPGGESRGAPRRTDGAVPPGPRPPGAGRPPLSLPLRNGARDVQPGQGGGSRLARFGRRSARLPARLQPHLRGAAGPQAP